MKIVENSVKFGETIILDHKFYLKTTKFRPNFVPAVGILSKIFVPGVGFLNEKFSGPGVSPGEEDIGQGDTCIILVPCINAIFTCFSLSCFFRWDI